MVVAGGVPWAETTGALRNRTVIAEVRIRNSRTSQVAGRMGRMGASARIFATLATRKLKDLRWSVTLAYRASQIRKSELLSRRAGPRLHVGLLMASRDECGRACATPSSSRRNVSQGGNLAIRWLPDSGVEEILAPVA